MSFRVVALAARVEASDDLHQARLLVLLGAQAGSGGIPRPVEGIMKLAKMDFLLRYPNVLLRAIDKLKPNSQLAKRAAAIITEGHRDTVEGQMIRFRYGPWDNRYRRWLGVLRAKGLVKLTKEGKTIMVRLTDKGTSIAQALRGREEFADLNQQAKLVVSAVGSMTATRLKSFVYTVAPEIVDMKWGESISL